MLCSKYKNEEKTVPVINYSMIFTCLSLLKVKVDIPYQKVIDYVNHFSRYRKTESLICSLCLFQSTQVSVHYVYSNFVLVLAYLF